MGWIGALLALGGIVLLAACGSSDPSASGGSSTSSAYAKAVKYAQCIRAHGIPDFPDPNSKGQFMIQNGASNPTAHVSIAVANRAMKACKSLAPPSVAQGPPSQGGNATGAALKFTACMRHHGIPGFPDPASNGSITLPKNINPESPQFQKAQKACQSLMPINPSGQGGS